LTGDATGDETGERTYTGWKVGLVIVAATFVLFSILNLVAKSARHPDDKVRPTPTVLTATPS
jgi:hypothetical protein